MNTSSPLPELPAIGFLAEMECPHREFLASYGKFIRPKLGEVIIGEGQAQGSLYLILAGTLHVVFTSGERPLLLASLGAGDSIGEVNLFDPAVASASVIARSECLIWVISGAEIASFFAADPEAAVEFMKGLLRLAGKRIRAMNVKLADSEQKAAFHGFWQADD
jgi:CRP/FNR family cyclic AMP-dependent transcriptional regulator